MTIGRPKRPPATKQGHKVAVYLTADQVAALDAARGAETRSAYLARMAGLATSPPQA